MWFIFALLNTEQNGQFFFACCLVLFLPLMNFKCILFSYCICEFKLKRGAYFNLDSKIEQIQMNFFYFSIRKRNVSSFPCVKNGFPDCSAGKESACNAGDQSLIPGLRRYHGEGNSYLLQYSCWENSMARGAWNWANTTFTYFFIRRRNFR